MSSPVIFALLVSLSYNNNVTAFKVGDFVRLDQCVTQGMAVASADKDGNPISGNKQGAFWTGVAGTFLCIPTNDAVASENDNSSPPSSPHWPGESGPY